MKDTMDKILKILQDSDTSSSSNDCFWLCRIVPTFDFPSPNLNTTLSNHDNQPVAVASWQLNSLTVLRLGNGKTRVELKCKDFSLDDCITPNSRFGQIVARRPDDKDKDGWSFNFAEAGFSEKIDSLDPWWDRLWPEECFTQAGSVGEEADECLVLSPSSSPRQAQMDLEAGCGGEGADQCLGNALVGGNMSAAALATTAPTLRIESESNLQIVLVKSWIIAVCIFYSLTKLRCMLHSDEGHTHRQQST